MIFGGIDTTGNTLGFLLYHLAANPDKQEILEENAYRLEIKKVMRLNDKGCVHVRHPLSLLILFIHG